MSSYNEDMNKILRKYTFYHKNEAGVEYKYVPIEMVDDMVEEILHIKEANKWIDSSASLPVLGQEIDFTTRWHTKGYRCCGKIIMRDGELYAHEYEHGNVYPIAEIKKWCPAPVYPE